MLTTVGRGGDGQKIRDEILHIMHRNKVWNGDWVWTPEYRIDLCCLVREIQP